MEFLKQIPNSNEEKHIFILKNNPSEQLNLLPALLAKPGQICLLLESNT